MFQKYNFPDHSDHRTHNFFGRNDDNNNTIINFAVTLSHDALSPCNRSSLCDNNCRITYGSSTAMTVLSSCKRDTFTVAV